MQMPGEALLLKMWETLIEKGIGALISPYYTVWKNKKLALSGIELDKISKIAIAEGKKEIAELNSTRLLITNELKLTDEQDVFPIGTLQDNVRKNEVRKLIQEELNVTQAIVYANNRLSNDEANLPEEEMSQDWLNTWRDNASKVSDKDVQSLWGNVLAQEFLEPGRYSLRLLEFLRTMSKSDALLIEKIAPYASKFGVIFGVNISQKFLTDDDKFIEGTNIDKTDLKLLEEIGFISDVSTLGMVKEITNIVSEIPNANHEVKYMGCVPINEDKILTISSKNTENKLSIAYFPMTKIGKEVLGLVKYEVEPHHLEWLANQLREDYEVALFNYLEDVEEQVHLFNFEL